MIDEIWPRKCQSKVGSLQRVSDWILDARTDAIRVLLVERTTGRAVEQERKTFFQGQPRRLSTPQNLQPQYVHASDTARDRLTRKPAIQPEPTCDSLVTVRRDHALDNSNATYLLTERMSSPQVLMQ